MKKLNVIMLALIASIGAMAQSANTVVVNITAANDSKDVLNLIEVSTFVPEYKAGEDAGPKLMPAGDNVYIYSVLGDKDCSQIGTNHLIGTPITVKTNSSTSYTFSFTGKTGKTFSLLDREKNISTPMVEGSKYTFTAEPISIISGRFEVGEFVPAPFSVCHQYGKIIVDNSESAALEVSIDNTSIGSVPADAIAIELAVPATIADGHHTLHIVGGAIDTTMTINVNPEVIVL